MASLLPPGKSQFFDGSGIPLAGGTVTTYVPGTTTPKTTYQDSGQVTPNSNPITLDASGSAFIYGNGSYRTIIQNSTGTTIWDVVTQAPLTDASLTGGDLADEVTLASGATVDIGAPATTRVLISGTTTITSFGAVGNKIRYLRAASTGLTLTYNATTLILPGAANITTLAGDTFTAVSDALGNWRVIQYLRADASSVAPAPLFQCQLIYVNGTSIKLQTAYGNRIFINGRFETIPSAGVTLANTGLTAATSYYVYAYMNSGTMTLEASTTAYATDTTFGVVIKTGDASRSHVGRVYMDAGTPGAFADTPAKRYVASYYNRRDRTIVGAAVGGATTTGGSLAELSSGARVLFVSWSDDLPSLFAAGYASNSAANSYVFAAMMVNSVASGNYALGSNGANLPVPLTIEYNEILSEGINTASIAGAVQSGTGTFNNLAVHGKVRI